MAQIMKGAFALLLIAAIPFASYAQTCTPAAGATYRLTFDATWSAQTLPQQFPPNPHFSGLVGAAHSDAVTFWDAGEPASFGIEIMAETGSKNALLNEVNGAVNAGTALGSISGGGVGTSPGTAIVDFDVTQSHSLATVVTMIAPSPDWFVGVSGFDLFGGGSWATEASVDLFGYDAGTDNGTTYTSTNSDTQPPDPIGGLDGPMFVHNGVLVPFGRFTFQRLTAACTDGDGDNVADDEDNCSALSNSNQVDADGDGFGNACDADLNNDCTVNTQDLGLLKVAFFTTDPVADLNVDNIVNTIDLGILKLAFFGAPGPSGTTSACTPLDRR